MLGNYLENQNPKNPIKFRVTNLMDKLLFYVHDHQMIEEFLVKKVHLYEK